jgi:hypothetical protein
MCSSGSGSFAGAPSEASVRQYVVFVGWRLANPQGPACFDDSVIVSADPQLAVDRLHPGPHAALAGRGRSECVIDRRGQRVNESGQSATVEESNIVGHSYS